MNDLFSSYAGEPLYIQIYMYYRDRIIDGTLKHGDKLPSIRKCAAEYNVSKLTVESAYMQLTAEGYVYSKSQSGYYVCKLSDLQKSRSDTTAPEESESNAEVKYDLSGSSADSSCFDFQLWQKYIKNALRCEERLIGYGEYQGEYDLRKALSDYAVSQRGVVCRPSRIVVGAGVQNILQLLCSLDGTHYAVIFAGAPFPQGVRIFEDFGYRIYYGTDSYDGKVPVRFIYVSPAHFSEEDDVMSISERIELLNFARENDCIVIEDDFDSEFCYFSRPVPSLQGLDGGEQVAYIGTMSRLLLPSIRISFMVLPKKMVNDYKVRGSLYNQTASKTEQIALARYITDSRLTAQIRKARKLYEAKTGIMKSLIAKHIVPESIDVSDSGFIIYFDVKTDKNAELLKKVYLQKGVAVKNIVQIKQNTVRFFVSSMGVSEEEIEPSVKLLKNMII